MEKRKKKMNFLIGWILRIPRLDKIRARNQEALLVDLLKQVNELEAELWKRRARHQKRDVDNFLDAEKKEDPVEYQTCGTKEEQEEKEEIKDEDVKEVNFYKLWDAEFEMSLKDIDDGLQ